MSAISGLATKIFQTEFDGDTGAMPRSYIEAWLESNLGQLNSLINTSYSGIGAELDLESSALYKEMYMSNYYKKQSRNALRGLVGDSNGSDILSLRDGNSAVTFTNKNEVAKVYKSLAQDCEEKINKLAHQYNMYQSEPLQLGGLENDFVHIVGEHRRSIRP
jgi:uncharacterized protein YacL (UPF0231 family)